MVTVKKLTLLEAPHTAPLLEVLEDLCGTTARADLYILNGKLRLLLRQSRFSKKIKTNAALNGRLEISKTLEYGRCITQNAVIRVF